MQTITAVTLTIGLTTIGHLGLQSTLGAAYGKPNHFKPDFTKYKPVNTKKYSEPHLYWREVANWKTPTEIQCDVTGELSCFGLHIHPPSKIQNTQNSTKNKDLKPGDCPSHEFVVFYRSDSKWFPDADGSVLDNDFTEPCHFVSYYKLLPRGYKITFKDFTCAVGKEIDLACTNGIHGFVITPTDGWTY